jgi:hypothetical protein
MNRTIRLPDLTQPKGPPTAPNPTSAAPPAAVRVHPAHTTTSVPPAREAARPGTRGRTKVSRLQPIVLLALITVTFAILVAAIISQSGKQETPKLPASGAEGGLPSTMAESELIDDEEEAELPSSDTEQTAEGSADEPVLEAPATAEGEVPAPREDWPPFPAEGQEESTVEESAHDGSGAISGSANSSENDPIDEHLEPGMARLEGNIIE